VWSHLVEVVNSHQQGPVWPVVLTGLTGVGQWTRGLVFRCVLGSEGYVLVPRSSGTPVATWAWPIWVVSRRRVLEAMFILMEFPSPSRRIFIGSHSLPPPLWFAVSVFQEATIHQSSNHTWSSGNRLVVVHVGAPSVCLGLPCMDINQSIVDLSTLSEIA
jgi:hypothetical protein